MTRLLSSDPHGRVVEEVPDEVEEADQVYSAGDLIDRGMVAEHAADMYEEVDGQEDFQNLDDEKKIEAYQAVAEEIDEAYGEAGVTVYTPGGNHGTEFYPGEGSVWEEAENVVVKNYDKVEDEDGAVVFGESHLQDSPAAKAYLAQNNQLYRDQPAAEVYSEEGEEEVIEVTTERLEKDEAEVTFGDIEDMLDKNEGDSEEAGRGGLLGGLMDYLEDTIFERVTEIYDNILDWYSKSSAEAEDDYDVELSENHTEWKNQRQRLVEEVPKEEIQKFESRIESTVEEIESCDEPVTFVTHGTPNELAEYGSAYASEVIKRSNNLEAAYTGHSHEELEEELYGTRVVNPGQGYTADSSGRLEPGEHGTSSWMGANGGEPRGRRQPNPEEAIEQGLRVAQEVKEQNQEMFEQAKETVENQVEEDELDRLVERTGRSREEVIEAMTGNSIVGQAGRGQAQEAPA